MSLIKIRIKASTTILTIVRSFKINDELVMNCSRNKNISWSTNAGIKLAFSDYIKI